jgi:hypothetical protein
LGDDEASSEFRPTIASLQNLVILEFETAFTWSTATDTWRIYFFERLLSHRKRATLLCSIWPIPMI